MNHDIILFKCNKTYVTDSQKHTTYHSSCLNTLLAQDYETHLLGQEQKSQIIFIWLLNI